MDLKVKKNFKVSMPTKRFTSFAQTKMMARLPHTVNDSCTSFTM